jgi:hypothetical protein
VVVVAVGDARVGEQEEEAKNPKGQVSIINIQRANNVGILLCRFPISHGEIRKSILACDEVPSFHQPALCLSL